jgi:hypothetical protein
MFYFDIKYHISTAQTVDLSWLIICYVKILWDIKFYYFFSFLAIFIFIFFKWPLLVHLKNSYKTQKIIKSGTPQDVDKKNY